MSNDPKNKDSGINALESAGKERQAQNEGTDNEQAAGGRFLKIRRIAALAGVILLVGIYVVAFIAGIGKWENAHAVFMTAVWLSIAVPAVIYIMLVLYRIAQKRNRDK